MFVGGVVVDDQMNVQLRRDAVVEAAQKREKLLMPVPRFAFGENGPGGDDQRSKQSRRSVADVIMGNALHIAEPHRQDRLSSIQRLNLALFVHTELQRVIGWDEIKPHDIAHLLDKERIGGKLESARAMGLNGKGLK